MEMVSGNPFTLTFGKRPEEYIIRYESSDEIVSAFTSNLAKSQTYMIRGVRGCGKTVLLTTIAKQICEKDDWIGVDLNPAQNLLDDFANRLEDACERMGNILNRGFDVSVAGFGIGIGGRDNRDSVSRIERMLDKLVKENRRVLITIDEAISDKSMKQFASQFQIWIRKDYPLFLLMTGLYENIDAIQNNPQLTFLLRSPKITLEPLGISQILKKYQNTLSISKEEALRLAKLTKGYAFAFQALGMIYWEQRISPDISDIISQFDDLLDEYVYRKIWSTLSRQDKEIVACIKDGEKVKTGDICKRLNLTSSVFSKYRERLMNKGIMVSSEHGYVEFALPRFGEICGLYFDCEIEESAK